METYRSTAPRAPTQLPGAPDSPPHAQANEAPPATRPATTPEVAPEIAPAPDALAQRLNYLFRRTTANHHMQALKRAIHAYREVPLP